jgi:hypothetical protein
LDLKDLKKEFENELTKNILSFWVKEVYDPERRIFYGRITNDGKKFPEAPLSAVFMTRIMWTFSAAYRCYPAAIYRHMAGEAFRILLEMFHGIMSMEAFTGAYFLMEPRWIQRSSFMRRLFLSTPYRSISLLLKMKRRRSWRLKCLG